MHVTHFSGPNEETPPRLFGISKILFALRTYLFGLNASWWGLRMGHLLVSELVVGVQVGAPAGLVPDHAEGTRRLAVAPVWLRGDVYLEG